MRKGLARQVISELASTLAGMEPSWKRVGRLIARREGPWVHIVGIDESRWADEFVPAHGLTYLRAWDSTPRIEGTLGRERLGSARYGVDDWISERLFRSDPAAIAERMRERWRPRIDEALGPDVAERLIRERGEDWNAQHALVFIASEGGDRLEAMRCLAELERLAVNRPLDDFVESARAVVALIDQPGPLRAHLDAIEEAKLASVKGRSLG